MGFIISFTRLTIFQWGCCCVALGFIGIGGPWVYLRLPQIVLVGSILQNSLVSQVWFRFPILEIDLDSSWWGSGWARCLDWDFRCSTKDLTQDYSMIGLIHKVFCNTCKREEPLDRPWKAASGPSVPHSNDARASLPEKVSQGTGHPASWWRWGCLS